MFRSTNAPLILIPPNPILHTATRTSRSPQNINPTDEHNCQRTPTYLELAQPAHSPVPPVVPPSLGILDRGPVVVVVAAAARPPCPSASASVVASSVVVVQLLQRVPVGDEQRLFQESLFKKKKTVVDSVVAEDERTLGT